MTAFAKRSQFGLSGKNLLELYRGWETSGELASGTGRFPVSGFCGSFSEMLQWSEFVGRESLFKFIGVHDHERTARAAPSTFRLARAGKCFGGLRS